MSTTDTTTYAAGMTRFGVCAATPSARRLLAVAGRAARRAAAAADVATAIVPWATGRGEHMI